MTQSVQYAGLGALALFLPLVRRDLNLGFAEAGIISAASTASYAVMQIPSGVLADRLGARRVFLYGLAGTSLLTASLGGLHEYWLVVMNQGAAGIFRALAFAPGMVLIARLFRPDRRATAVGLFVSGGFAANLLVNVAGPALVASVGWREIFVGLGAVGLAVMGVVAWATRNLARAETPVALSAESVRATLASPTIWLTSMVQFVRLAVAGGIAFWLPTLLIDDKGFTLTQTGLIVGMGAALTAASNFIGGYVADRLGRPLLVIAISLTLLAASILGLMVASDHATTIAAVALISLFMQLYFGPLFAIPIQRLRLHDAGFATGFGNLFANVGGMIAVFGLGTLKDATGGFGIGLTLLAALCVVGLVPLALIGTSKPRQLPTAA